MHLRQHLNTFFLLKKEVRALAARHQSVHRALRQIERELNVLDAQGQGKGLSQATIFRYRELQTRQWRESERLSSITSALAAFGQQFVCLFAVLDGQLLASDRLAVLGEELKRSVLSRGARPRWKSWCSDIMSRQPRDT
ncbi:hypothetical protein OMP44_15500 [Pseudomonas sp. CBMAI 2609]|uniref:Transposase n=1 Tax=Pseudomonas flavocrustae TaxID=2991719 RepID=A0ABT6IKD4_9PSED|nr:hypothetical protein [Pseudomonas sp. CBMAI 2609]MDH4764295.1 hypothetical protein [Pseudomonas sp. CBMAI 2609]